MTLSPSAQISLDTIRFKVEKQLYDLNQIEKLALKEVYEEIQSAVKGKKITLDTSCNGCCATAMNICHNFVKFHEVRTPQKPQAPLKPANVERKSVSESIEEHIDLKHLTVPELQDICREQGIKFHHKIKEDKLIELILNKQNEEVPE